MPLSTIFLILALIFNLSKWVYFNLSLKAVSICDEKPIDERGDVQNLLNKWTKILNVITTLIILTFLAPLSVYAVIGCTQFGSGEIP